MSTSRYFPNPFPAFGPVEISPQVFKSRTLTFVDHILRKFHPSHRNCDGGLYVGAAGVAYALYYLAKNEHFHSHRQKLLQSAQSYIDVSLDYFEKKRLKKKNAVSFLLENGGMYVVAALLSSAKEDHQKCKKYVEAYRSLADACEPLMFLETGSDELFVGRKKNAVSFLLENGGMYVVAALLSSAKEDHQKCKKYVEAYRSLADACEPLMFLETGSDELFVGRSGYLLGVLLLQRELGIGVLNDHEINVLCQRIIESGKQYRSKLEVDIDIPLLYCYHGTIYLGAGHGIAGILQVLLSFPTYLERHSESARAVQKSVDFLLHKCMKQGNIPTDLEGVVYPGYARMLVHWCHGASGLIYTFARAYLVFGKNTKYLDACITLGETIWEKGLLKKGPGICHGVAGSGYAFLLLYRLTGEEKYLYRAERFGSFIFTEVFDEGARTPDSPFSLFEGLAGTVCFLGDLLQPHKAEFPFLNVFLE